ncbi:hypothetical protein DPMN_184935 [Dreissena polymorpha]|uniref:Uncharacterized protein n=1 Tax=Dreissena polymorpha TaxID=45954 RepID=A0A9D4I7V2_DREPO|nr:hypothetical protein DPMN_184935 [Dreissena polymorpha]
MAPDTKVPDGRKDRRTKKAKTISLCQLRGIISIGKNQQTNQPTDQQTGQKQYVPHYNNIMKTNVLTKFPEGWTIHVISRNRTILKLIQDIKISVLTKFHKDWKIHVTLRVLTRNKFRPLKAMFFNQLELFHEDRKIIVASRVKNAPPPGGIFFPNIPEPFSNSSKISL